LPVLIDGNNLLHAVRALEDPERLFGRFMLCEVLGRWARRYGERVHVVFDGPEPAAELREQLGHANIELSFSGGQTADDLIHNLLESNSAARRLLVVSSDHAVQRAAKRRRARPQKSDDFWITVKRDLKRPNSPKAVEPEEKRRGLNSTATETWLEEFGFGDSGSGSQDPSAS
jgi:hypothetical protein